MLGGVFSAIFDYAFEWKILMPYHKQVFKLWGKFEKQSVDAVRILTFIGQTLEIPLESLDPFLC